MSLTSQIKEHAKKLGFFRVGIARAETFPGLKVLEGWIKDKKHGEMNWMERTKDKRQNPSLVLPGVQSIIVVGMNYYISERLESPPGMKISKYAWGEDYHILMEKKLKQLTEFILSLYPSRHTKYYVDTGPVMEKAWAQKAGLGWIGKNTNLISPGHGSYLFLGEILLDQELEYDEPGVDLCGGCALCIEVCPTKALTPYSLDSNQCISYLTIEKKGEIAPELKSAMGEWIYGCDDCQDICPWNASPQISEEPGFNSINSYLTELNPQNLQEINFTEVFKRSPIKRIKRQGLLRNLQIAQENKEKFYDAD